MHELTSSPPQRIAELDGLRAFAVLSVVVYHMAAFSLALPLGPRPVASLITYIGPSGVNVFFIISGYIITTLLMRENTAATQPSLAGFYIRRVFRIVPPLALYLLVILTLRITDTIRIPLKDILWASLFLGDTTLLSADSWFVIHTWSLSVEEQFYLVFPPLLTFVLGFRSKRVLMALVPAYLVCAVAEQAAHVLSVHAAPFWLNLSALHYFRYIIVGVLLATHGKVALARLKDRSRLWPVALFGASVLLKKLPINLPASNTFGAIEPAVAVACSAIEPLVCGLFVMWFMQNPERCATLRRPIVQWVGACSYSIYLWQQLFTPQPHLQYGEFLKSPWLAGSAILACAAFSYYVVERPCIRLGRALARRGSSGSGERG